jgi:hypothetical protein
MLAIRNYMKMQEQKEPSNILSGPVTPIALDKDASSEDSDDSQESDDGIPFFANPYDSILTP